MRYADCPVDEDAANHIHEAQSIVSEIGLPPTSELAIELKRFEAN